MDALQRIINIAYQKHAKSKLIVTTFLDFANAFDTANHEILLDKFNVFMALEEMSTD